MPESLAQNLAVETASVGEDVRALRKLRGMTLTEVAERLDRSIGWLSQVERGQTEPSITDLRKTAALFEVPLSFFFRNHDAPEEERGLVVRKANRTTLGSREGGLVEELLSPDLSGEFEMIRSVFAPGAETDNVPARPAQDGGYIVSGRLDLWIDGKKFELSEGDSFQFQNCEYRWCNPGDSETLVIWIISPPVY